MDSVLNEIGKIHFVKSKEVAPVAYNHYMVEKRNLDRTKTAFCFGVPIYNQRAKKIVNLKFHQNKLESYFHGSSATVKISDKVYFKNDYGACSFSLFGKITKKTADSIHMDSSDGCAVIKPTLNGLFFKVPCFSSRLSTTRITIDCPFESISSNGKYFAVMKEKFTPLVTVSCIGILNDRGDVIAPCTVNFEKLNAKEFALTFETGNKSGKYIAYEINMHEAKLFQDTTVESKNPKMNNAFGTTAFLGTTDAFGEQWLYSRLEFSNLPILQNKKILKAVLHVPKLNRSDCLLTANRISSRFCSLGSNWENKITIKDAFAETEASDGYYHVNLTNLIGQAKLKSENFVIRATPNTNYAVISTGDSFFRPQILEIKFQ